jgi:hypothetical protein
LRDEVISREVALGEVGRVSDSPTHSSFVVTSTVDGSTDDGPTLVSDAATPAGWPGDDNTLAPVAADTAREARVYLRALAEVASGAQPETALPVLLLTVSQVLVTGARLGAITDVLPLERFEPDVGPDADIDPLRQALSNLLDGLDDYADVVDPLTGVELAPGSLSNDLIDVAAALSYGLQHYDAGRVTEALWWWQFSYLSAWGDRAASALRVLQSMLSHLRLDADEDLVADAEFEALHP